jgi:hypothetical protein
LQPAYELFIPHKARIGASATGSILRAVYPRRKFPHSHLVGRIGEQHGSAHFEAIRLAKPGGDVSGHFG